MRKFSGVITAEFSRKERGIRFGKRIISRAIRWLNMSSTILSIAVKEYRSRDKFLPGDFVTIRNVRSSVYKCPAYNVQTQSPSMVPSGISGIVLQKLGNDTLVIYELLVGNEKYNVESRFLTVT